jgi:uncharacterized protein (DUF1501 family)
MVNLSRRDFLSTAATSAATLALPSMGLANSRLPLSTAKSCIFVNLIGGPSHLDTFDPKPDAPLEIRGPFKPIKTKVPGLYLSELFPKLAKLTDKFSLIRSIHHTAPPIHEAGLQLLNTGYLFRDGPAWPSMGSVWTYLNGECELGIGRRHYVVPSPDVDTGIQIEKGFGPGFLSNRVRPQTTNVNCSHDFDVPLLAARRTLNPAYGLTAFGYNCQAAVTSVIRYPGQIITINQFPTVFDSPSWDCHADGGSLRTDLSDIRDTVAPSFDAAFAALLSDLDARGLLDSTLVVATGEFGRTPRLNANGGRDHWAGCWTALVAGGGVKGGHVVGRTDPRGVEPTDRPVTPQELVATIFHALGVAPDATIPGPDGSPVAIYPGQPVTELF